MGFRNIMISSNMKLRIQDQQLVVTAGDEVHIPLDPLIRTRWFQNCPRATVRN